MTDRLEKTSGFSPVQFVGILQVSSARRGDEPVGGKVALCSEQRYQCDSLLTDDGICRHCVSFLPSLVPRLLTRGVCRNICKADR